MLRRHPELARLYSLSALVCLLAGNGLASGEEAEPREARGVLELRLIVPPNNAGAEKVQASPEGEPLWVHQEPLLAGGGVSRSARVEEEGRHAVELLILDAELSKKLIELAGSAVGQRAVVLEEGRPVAVVTLSVNVGKGRPQLAVRSKEEAVHVTSCFLRAAGWGNLGGELWGHLKHYGENRRYYGRRVKLSLEFYNAGPRPLPMPKEYQEWHPIPSLRSGIELMLTGPDGKRLTPFNNSRFKCSEVSQSLSPGSHVNWFGVDLGNWFTLEKPGQYQFRVRFTRELCEFIEGESNPITFELLGDAEGSAGGIEVKLQPMGEHKLGGEMRVKYHITNRTTDHLNSIESLVPNSDFAGELEFHRVGADSLERVPRWWGARSSGAVILDFLPGETLSGTFDLADIYCIRRPGTYRARLVFTQSSGAAMEIRVSGPPVASVGTDIRGTVFGPEGKPLAGAKIKLSEHRWPYQGGGHETPLRRVGTNWSDVEGRYEFRYLRGDSPKYYFEFTHRRFVRSKKEIEAQPGKTEYVVDAKLERGFAFHGLVQDAQEQPIEGAKVTDDDSQKEALTDARGCFRLEGLSHNYVSYHCSRKGYGYVNAGLTIQGDRPCVIVLERLQRYEVEGTASFMSGRPFGKRRLRVYLKDGGGKAVNAYCRQVDQVGKFSLKLPGPGPYSGPVTASAEDYRSSGPPFVATLEGVSAGDRDLKLAFDDTGELRVRVSAPGNRPDYAKVSVSALRRYETIERYRDRLYPVASEELPPSGGTARLRASPGPLQVRVGIARLGKWKCVRELEIESGKQRDVEIALPMIKFGTVRGQVTFPEDGQPRGAYVWFRHSLGNISARVGPDGHFSSPPVPAGKVSVRIDREEKEAIVEPGAETDIGQVILEAYGKIAGSVKYPDGTPALGVTMRTTRGDMVGPQGQFRRACPPGKTSVKAYYRDYPQMAGVIRDVVVPAGGTVRADIVVPKGGGTSVTGRLSGFREPSPGMVLYKDNRERWVSRGWWPGGNDTFSFHEVPEGDAVIVFAERTDKGASYFGYRSVKVKNEPVRLEIDGTETGTIEGSVVAPAGDPQAAIWVKLAPRVLVDRPVQYERSRPSSSLSHCTTELYAEIDKGGAFRFVGVAPGEYVVIAGIGTRSRVSRPVTVPGKGALIKVRLQLPAPQP